MRILLDHTTPAPLRYALRGHQVETAYEKGWAELLNGDLITEAELAGFDLLITTDQGIRYQQNWAGRTLARTSHTTSTAARDGPMSTSLRSGDVLDVLSSTPAGVASRAPRIHGPLTRLVTILCEKSGLALLVLSTNDWTRLRRIKERILMAVESIQPSTRVEFEVPKSE